VIFQKIQSIIRLNYILSCLFFLSSCAKEEIVIAEEVNTKLIVNWDHRYYGNPGCFESAKVLEFYKLNSTLNEIVFDVKNNPCVIQGKISRADYVNKVYMQYLDGTKVPLKLNSRGGFVAQVLIPERIYNYSIVVEDIDSELNVVKYNFTLNLLD
jgi:hypothetical protein